MAIEKKGKMITITSMKGGVGKTTIALLLASIYKKLNKKVLLMDLDLYTGSLAFALNADIKSSIYNLCDDMANNRSKGINTGDYIYNYDEKIDILAAPKDPRQASKVDLKCLEILMNSLPNYYDVILIDTNHMLDVYNMIAFEYSSCILDIFTNDVFDLKGTKSIVSICKNVGVDNFVLTLNESSDDRKKYFSEFDVKTLVKHPIDYIISNNYYLKNFDMYVMENKLFDYFFKLKTKNKEIEKLALRLLEDGKKGAKKNEEE